MNPRAGAPWGERPEIDWDGENVEHLARHRVRPWEVEEMVYEGYYDWWKHPKWRRGGKYGGRYLLRGRTLGGRRLLVVLDRKGRMRLRPLTGWDD